MHISAVPVSRKARDGILTYRELSNPGYIVVNRFDLSPIRGTSWVVGSSCIFYITRYKTLHVIRSGRSYYLHHASLSKQIKVTATYCKHILCDKEVLPPLA